MTDLVGLDGRPLDSALVAPAAYMEHLGERSGFDDRQRAFLRANLPGVSDTPPAHMSRSQRQIAALRQALLKLSIDNMQLWLLIGAFTEASGGTATFDQATVKKFREPAKWPAVTSPDGQTIHVSFPFRDVQDPHTYDPQLELAYDPAPGGGPDGT